MHNKKHNFQSYPSRIQYINSIKFRQTVQSRQGPLISSTTLVCQFFSTWLSQQSLTCLGIVFVRTASASLSDTAIFSRTAPTRCFWMRNWDLSENLHALKTHFMDRWWIWIRQKSKNLPFSRFKKVTSTSDMFFFWQNWATATKPEPTQGSSGVKWMAHWASKDKGPRELIQTFSSHRKRSFSMDAEVMRFFYGLKP